MIVRRDQPRFDLTTAAAFTASGVWLIEVDFSFRRTAKGPMRVLLNQARLAVTAALTRQALRGRDLGAQTVQVRFTSGEHRVDFPLHQRHLASSLFLL